MNKDELISKINDFTEFKKTILEIYNKTQSQTITQLNNEWVAYPISPLHIRDVMDFSIDNQNLAILTCNFNGWSSTPKTHKLPIVFITDEKIKKTAIERQLSKVKKELDKRNLFIKGINERVSVLLATILDYKFQILNFLRSNGYNVDDLYIESDFVYITLGGRHIKVYTVKRFYPVKLIQVKQLIAYQPVKSLIRKFMLQEAKLKTYIY